MLPNILTQAQLSFCKVSDKKPNNNEYKGLYQAHQKYLESKTEWRVADGYLVIIVCILR